MKSIKVFLSKNFQFLEVKSSIYFNRRVFVMENINNFWVTKVSSIALDKMLLTTKMYSYFFLHC